MKTTLNKAKRLKFVLYTTFFLFISTTIVAQSGLVIHPKRLVFEGTTNKTATLYLSNTGKDTARYHISFVQIRMTEQGRFEPITDPDPGQLFATPYLRHFPRKVLLAPNESQAIKVQVTRTNELQPGEYRSHLYFRSVPDNNSQGNESDNGSSLSINLIPVYGVTIPCIIRIGESTPQVRISNLSLNQIDEQPVISMNFNRNGNMSSYGDITITHTAHNGKKTKVGEIKGFAVYTPGNLRKAQISLQNPRGVDYENGKLSVVYTNQEKGPKRVVFSEAELILY